MSTNSTVNRVPVWTWRDAVRKASVPPLTKLVCWAIGNYLADVGEGCFPPVKTLMADTGLSNRSLATHLQKAVEHGLLKVTRERGADGRIKRTIYHPLFPEYVDLARKPAADRPPAEDDQVSEAHADRPSEGRSRGKRLHRKLHVKKVHPDKPSEAGSPGPDEPGAGNHVNEVHGNLPLQPSISPPTPQGGERVKRIDRLIEEVRSAKPDRDRVIDLLFDPILRQRSLIRAPDKAYSLGVIADWARQYPDALLIAARDTLLRERDNSVKPADIEATVKRLAAVAKTQARADAIRTAPKPTGMQVLTPLAGETQALQAALGRRLPDQAISQFFSAAFAAERDGSTLRVAFPVPFAKRWVDGHFAEILQAAAAEGVPGIAQVETIVGTAAQPPAIGEMQP